MIKVLERNKEGNPTKVLRTKLPQDYWDSLNKRPLNTGTMSDKYCTEINRLIIQTHSDKDRVEIIDKILAGVNRIDGTVAV